MYVYVYVCVCVRACVRVLVCTYEMDSTYRRGRYESRVRVQLMPGEQRQWAENVSKLGKKALRAFSNDDD
jgi:hypothetical protein